MKPASLLSAPSRSRRAGRCARAALAALTAVTLAGCATLADDAGFGGVAQAAKSNLGAELAWARSPSERAALDARVAELLRAPLSADAAVQVALLNHRGLQAAFDELGISDAERVQASSLPNPGFSFGRLRQGAATEIDRGVHVNLARLLMLPMLDRLETRRHEQVRADVTMRVLALAGQVRSAYYTALAAEETVRYMRQVQDAAEAGAELARRQFQAGNWNKLQQAREQGFHADAALNLARAEQARGAARERLIRGLGVWGAQTQFTLPERLPDLPAAPEDRPQIEQAAMAQRLDVQAARLGAEQLARNLGLVRVTRFVNVLELGAVRNSFSEEPVERGYEVTLELPLFDWGGARVARAEATYWQAVNRAAQTAIEARSEVREAYAAYRASHDIARHYRDEIVPLKKRISDENLLRYNGMLIGVFELLADARSQIASVNGYIEALRDFWLAHATLETALIGPAGTAAGPPPPGPKGAPDGAAGGH